MSSCQFRFFKSNVIAIANFFFIIYMSNCESEQVPKIQRGNHAKKSANALVFNKNIYHSCNIYFIALGRCSSSPSQVYHLFCTDPLGPSLYIYIFCNMSCRRPETPRKFKCPHTIPRCCSYKQKNNRDSYAP